MPFVPLDDVLPDLGEEETRTLIIPSAVPDDPLSRASYTFNEMYCDELECDCRRVLLYVQSSKRAGPTAVIGWGWESRAFYADWLGDDDDLLLDDLIGPVLNLPSPQSALSQPLLELVKEVLFTDPAYTERIQQHYRLFRERIAARKPALQGALAEPEGGRRTRLVSGSSSHGANAQACAEPAAGMSVLEILEDAGVEFSSKGGTPVIALETDEDGELIAPGERVLATDGDAYALVKPASIPELFAGDRRPPPSDEALLAAYQPLFYGIEWAVWEWCAGTGERIRDKEMERVYNDVRRRPTGQSEHGVVPYVQAAIRLYMSVNDLSEPEFEAVLRRLTRSARTFAMGHTSRNYFDCALEPIFGDDG